MILQNFSLTKIRHCYCYTISIQKHLLSWTYAGFGRYGMKKWKQKVRTKSKGKKNYSSLFAESRRLYPSPFAQPVQGCAKSESMAPFKHHFFCLLYKKNKIDLICKRIRLGTNISMSVIKWGPQVRARTNWSQPISRCFSAGYWCDI